MFRILSPYHAYKQHIAEREPEVQMCEAFVFLHKECSPEISHIMLVAKHYPMHLLALHGVSQ